MRPLRQVRVRRYARVVDTRVNDENTFKHDYAKKRPFRKSVASSSPTVKKKVNKPFKKDTRRQQRYMLHNSDIEALFGE